MLLKKLAGSNEFYRGSKKKDIIQYLLHALCITMAAWFLLWMLSLFFSFSLSTCFFLVLPIHLSLSFSFPVHFCFSLPACLSPSVLDLESLSLCISLSARLSFCRVTEVELEMLDCWVPVDLCSDAGLFPMDADLQMLSVGFSVDRGVAWAACFKWAPVVLGLLCIADLGVVVVSMWPDATWAPELTGLALPGRLDPAGDRRSYVDPHSTDMHVSGLRVSITQSSSTVPEYFLVLRGVTVRPEVARGREASGVSASLVLRSDGETKELV